MSDQEAGAEGAPLEQTRQLTIDALCEHFANDAMTVEEFERRVDRAHGASGVEALRDLLRDLPGGNLPAVAGPGARPVGQKGYSVTPPEHVRDTGWAVAILGGMRRAGRWTPARVNYSIAFCGGAEIDFREAVLGPGVTEVRIFAMWGGVEVIVPPDLNVECHGMGIMGGFDQAHDIPESADPAAPTLRISGVAVMGGVDITVRHPGESSKDARKRRRHERRERLASGREERRERIREIRDAGRDIARGVTDDVKRQLRGPGGGAS